MGTASTNYRSWVSPITAGCFIALGISGLMMMFHMRIPGVHGLHEWMGILFCIVGILHLAINWRTLVSYLRTRKGAVAAAAIIILSAVMLMGGEEERHEGPHGRRGPHAEQTGGPEL
jgi:hypothetical protein